MKETLSSENKYFVPKPSFNFSRQWKMEWHLKHLMPVFGLNDITSPTQSNHTYFGWVLLCLQVLLCLKVLLSLTALLSLKDLLCVETHLWEQAHLCLQEPSDWMYQDFYPGWWSSLSETAHLWWNRQWSVSVYQLLETFLWEERRGDTVGKHTSWKNFFLIYILTNSAQLMTNSSNDNNKTTGDGGKYTYPA